MWSTISPSTSSSASITPACHCSSRPSAGSAAARSRPGSPGGGRPAGAPPLPASPCISCGAAFVRSAIARLLTGARVGVTRPRRCRTSQDATLGGALLTPPRSAAPPSVAQGYADRDGASSPETRPAPRRLPLRRVRFEVTEQPISASYCHCTRCQRRTGGGVVGPGAGRAGLGARAVGCRSRSRLGATRRLRQGVLLVLRLGPVVGRSGRRRAGERPLQRVRRRPRGATVLPDVHGVRRPLGADSRTTACRAIRSRP